MPVGTLGLGQLRQGGRIAHASQVRVLLPVQKTLLHWQQDPDLAGMRDAGALAKPPDAERAEWQKLWADVEATLKKAGKP